MLGGVDGWIERGGGSSADTQSLVRTSSTHAYMLAYRHIREYTHMRICLLHTCIQGGGGRRKYKYDSFRDLLRAVRNKKNHFDHLPPGLQTTMVCALK